MKLRMYRARLGAVVLATLAVLLACEAEPDFRAENGGSAADPDAAAPAPGVSVSQVEALGGAIDVETPLAAYTAIQTEMANSLDDVGLNAGDALQHIANARGAYEQMFQDAANSFAPEADDRIQSAFKSAEDAARVSKRHAVLLSAASIEASLLEVAIRSLENGLQQQDADDMMTWFAVFEARLSLDSESSEAGAAASEIEATPSQISELADILLQDLYVRFTDQMRLRSLEALSAVEGGNAAAASRHAVEATGLYELIAPDVISRLGADASSEIEDQLDLLRDGSKEANLSTTRAAVQNTDQILGRYLAQS